MLALGHTRSISSKRKEVGEFDGILDEKHRNVVSNNIPISLVRVEFDRDASYISHGVRTTSASLYCGKAEENWGITGCVSKNSGMAHIFSTFIESEIAKGARSARMNDTLRNPLMVKTVDLNWRVHQ